MSRKFIHLGVLGAFAVILGCAREGALNAPTLSTTDEQQTLAKPTGPTGLDAAALKVPASVTLPDGRVAERHVHIFYRRGHAKPDGAGGGNGKGGGNGGGGNGGGETCYTFLAKGAKWKSSETYIVDGSGGGLPDDVLANEIATAVAAWNSEVSGDIFAGELGDVVDRANIGNLNDQNEVLFDAITDPGVIAVTITWGIFGGPPRGRELLEWDMVFDNDGDWSWGDAGPTDEDNLGAQGVMDLLNIAVHEVGHAAGLGHSGDTCADETMYAFAEQGETKKRTLLTGDIAGIQALYD